MIQVEHLCKTFRVANRNAGLASALKALFHRQYREIKALNDISFTIPDGEMVGYIGPNGAGRAAHVKEIGVVFGQRSQLWWDVPVIDSFELLKDIYKIPENNYRKMKDELAALLNLEDIIKTPTRQLSLGQRMRCEIAASLLHNPKILFLDEPTIGLDAVSKIAVRNFILNLNKNHNTTIILTTHDMQDIEALTNRIMLIGKGRLLMDGSLREFKDMASENESLDELVARLYRQYEI